MAVLTRDFDDEEEVIKIDDVFDTFVNKTEADNRYVNVTGDTMSSGDFTFNGTAKVYVPTPVLP
jgi:hypothetical protein